MQRIVSEEEWNGHWQDGFLTGVKRKLPDNQHIKFLDVQKKLLSFLSHHTEVNFLRYHGEIIVDILSPLDPLALPDDLSDQP